MYEAIDAISNQTLIKTTNKYELLRYIDFTVEEAFQDDIFVISYLGGIIKIQEFAQFKERVHVM